MLLSPLTRRGIEETLVQLPKATGVKIQFFQRAEVCFDPMGVLACTLVTNKDAPGPAAVGLLGAILAGVSIGRGSG